MSLFFHFANAETVSFEDLPVGKFFVYQNKIYLKTRNFLKIVLDEKYYQEPYNEADRYEYEHDEDFEKGANWELVNDGNGKFVEPKLIPVVRIISRG